MKLSPDKSDAQTIRGYGPGWIAINNDKLQTSLLVGSAGLRLDWGCRSFAALNADHFAVLAQQATAMQAEVVLFGSGERLRFVPPAWHLALIQQRIGMETMDTAAACRTFNILAGEGRRVLAALLLEQSET